MTYLRIFIALLLAVIVEHTIYTGFTHGWDFLTPFQDGLFSLTWQGQFYLDFLCYLMLSGLWVAWRGGFTAASIALGVSAGIMGFVVFGALFLIYTVQSRGNLTAVLLGVHYDPQPNLDKAVTSH